MSLQIGSKGGSVVTLQKKLLSLGLNPGPIDGVFGPKTGSAVKAFQIKNKLVPDGVVGPLTINALGISIALDEPAMLVPAATGTQVQASVDKTRSDTGSSSLLDVKVLGVPVVYVAVSAIALGILGYVALHKKK